MRWAPFFAASTARAPSRRWLRCPATTPRRRGSVKDYSDGALGSRRCGANGGMFGVLDVTERNFGVFRPGGGEIQIP